MWSEETKKNSSRIFTTSIINTEDSRDISRSKIVQKVVVRDNNNKKERTRTEQNRKKKTSRRIYIYQSKIKIKK